MKRQWDSAQVGHRRPGAGRAISCPTPLPHLRALSVPEEGLTLPPRCCLDQSRKMAWNDGILGSQMCCHRRIRQRRTLLRRSSSRKSLWDSRMADLEHRGSAGPMLSEIVVGRKGRCSAHSRLPLVKNACRAPPALMQIYAGALSAPSLPLGLCSLRCSSMRVCRSRLYSPALRPHPENQKHHLEPRQG